MNIVVRIVFQLIIIFNSVVCQDVCNIHVSGHFEICWTKPATLTSVKQFQWLFTDPIPTQLVLSYHEVTHISPHLFVARTNITVLKLNLANAILNFDPLSFNNLPHLERLEINNGTVLLKEKLFQHLHQLDSLTLAVDEKICSLHDVLARDLKNLSRLEIVNAKKVSVCPEFFNHGSKIDTITQLTYRGGSFQTLKVLAFSCLPNLEVLNITGSDLKVIETYAFGRLRNLRVLELSENPKLIHIPAYTFDNFQALDTLLLMNNQIRTIDEAAFRNLYHPLKTVNISGNDIERIEEKSFDGLRCEKLDLSANPTWDETSLATNSFSNAQIQELWVSSTAYSRRDYDRWGLQAEKTAIHYRLLDGTDYIIEGKSSTSTILVHNIDCAKCPGSDKFSCCILKKSRLTSVESRPGVNETAVTLDLDVTSIEADAFSNPAVTKLTIQLVQGQELMIVPHALVLENLYELQILNGPVVLQQGMFVELKSLKILAIQAKQTETMLCQVLPELPRLENLDIHNHRGVQDICHEKCRDNKSPMIKRLMYFYGSISVVNDGELCCLKRLEHLRFYFTSMNSIAPGAFKGLVNLKTLTLFHTNLHKISAAAFLPLVSLEYLQINEICIRSFDSRRFQQMVSNTSNYADYTDQLFFGLTHQQLLKFSPLNLYRDDLAEIRLAGDEIKWISQDELREYSSKSVKEINFLLPSVFPVLAASDAPSKIVDRDFGDYCRSSSSETTFQICIHARNMLVSVRPVGANSSRSNVSLTINENGIIFIKSGAFLRANINKLILNFSITSRLRASPESFQGLSGLEILILYTGPLDLGPNLFQELGSLVELKFSYRRAGATRLCNVLPDLRKLTNLTIYDQSGIEVCHETCGSSRSKSRISLLEYIGGDITVLNSGAFKCLKQLERLIITQTKLMIIDPDAFEGLNRISTIQLTHNEHLRHIPSGLFNHLVSLSRLHLQMNSIKSVGVQTFKLPNDTRLEVLDLSHNNILVIERWTFANLSCRKVDLSYNQISEIRLESFQGSNIAELFFVNDKNLFIDYVTWGLNDSTIVFQNDRPAIS